MPTIESTISISIVSHLQAHLVEKLLSDLNQYCKVSKLEVILTLNLPEVLPFDIEGYSFPVILIENAFPKGFAANHNQAFAKSTGELYCVVNPDVRLDMDVFPELGVCLQNNKVGVAAPLVVGADGAMEDSARRFPTPLRILCKALGGCRGSDYFPAKEKIFPEWVAGMFMMFRRKVFEEIGGFDERYFLYYEDVDICARLKLHGYTIALCPGMRVIHHAHRSSHRSLKYLKWHLSSMLHFFCSPVFFEVMWHRRRK